MDSAQVYESSYNQALAKAFSRNVIRDLLSKGSSEYLQEVICHHPIRGEIPRRIKARELFDQVFAWLEKTYRSEYVYKNYIVKKILLGTHSLNTSSMLSELRIGHCKADLVLLNGSSTVYEIKTELDNFSRLKKQMSDYARGFEFVYLVTSESCVNEALSELDEAVGILAFTGRKTFRKVRASQSHLENIDKGLIFSSMRKAEYQSVIKSNFGFIPDVPNGVFFNECKRLFQKLPNDQAHLAFLNAMKSRGYVQNDARFIHAVPDSLKAFALNSDLTGEEKNELVNLLEKNISI